MYTYTKLKEALMGTSKTLPREWTPNAVKAIVIGNQFIFVAYHIKQPKLVMLDPSEVMNDLKLNGAGGSLVNLLKQKQLSCMEEFYVDSIYQNYKGIMNLEEYIASLVNTRSRLRYYGYCQNVNPDELVQGYANAQLNQQDMYCYAGDKTRTGTVQFEAVENANWYSKYNLRPDKYPVGDADGGALARYFKRIELQIEEQYKAELTRIQHEGIEGAMVQLYNQDIANIDSIMSFFVLNKMLGKEKGTCAMTDAVLKCMADVRSLVKPVRLSQAQLKDFLMNKAKPNKPLLEMYGKFFGVYSKENTQLQLKDLVTRVQTLNGISGFTSALYEGLIRLVDDVRKSKNEVYLALHVVLAGLGVKVNDGDFLAVLKEQRSHVGCAEFYMSVLTNLGGYTLESLKRQSRRSTNG